MQPAHAVRGACVCCERGKSLGLLLRLCAVVCIRFKVRLCSLSILLMVSSHLLWGVTIWEGEALTRQAAANRGEGGEGDGGEDGGLGNHAALCDRCAGGLPRLKVACPLTSGSCEPAERIPFSRRQGPSTASTARGAGGAGMWGDMGNVRGTDIHRISPPRRQKVATESRDPSGRASELALI